MPNENLPVLVEEQPPAEPLPPPEPPPEPPPQVVPVHFARVDSDGRYVSTGVVPSDSVTLLEPDVVVGEVDPEMQYHDFASGGPVAKPAKPVEMAEMEFDHQQKTWVGNVEKLKKRKHREIEAERDRRLTDPVIEYDGIRLNAGLLDKQNLQDKITATASRIARGTPTPPQMLVWKDYDNVIRTFPNLEAYKTWLEGFAIALEERGMQAWAWSWAKKDQLAALQTFEEVTAFDSVA